jgi:hypothetical protein
MKYTNNKNNISEILKVYIINSITKSYILNIKIRPLVTEYALMMKLVDGTCFVHSFNRYAYFGQSWSYFDIQYLRLVILYLFRNCELHLNIIVTLSSEVVLIWSIIIIFINRIGKKSTRLIRAAALKLAYELNAMIDRPDFCTVTRCLQG